MELLLWRHAEAEDGIPDSSRRLTAKGYKQAEKMAAWLKPRLPGDTLILVSPTDRTQQTAATLGSNFTTSDDVGPGASPQALLRAAQWPHGERSVLIVGHQPTLGEVAALLLTGQDAGLSWSIKKGAIWWFTIRPRPDANPCQLRAVLSPDML